VSSKRNPRNEKPRVIPGMRSDLEPQPHNDPDFGPGLEYESGDFNADSTEADKIRQRWKKPSRGVKRSETAFGRKPRRS
jgi:hypothetical protein